MPRLNHFAFASNQKKKKRKKNKTSNVLPFVKDGAKRKWVLV